MLRHTLSHILRVFAVFDSIAALRRYWGAFFIASKDPSCSNGSRRITMKKTATIYSLFLVAGTAMAVSTMQQPRVERHQITNNQLWQNQRAIGDDACEDAGIFSNDAYPLTQSCSNAIYLGAINPSVPLDIDGDGVRDSIAGRAYYDKLMFNEIMTLLQKDGAASFRAVTLLDLESITYEGFEGRRIFYN